MCTQQNDTLPEVRVFKMQVFSQLSFVSSFVMSSSSLCRQQPLLSKGVARLLCGFGIQESGAQFEASPFQYSLDLVL